MCSASSDSPPFRISGCHTSDRLPGCRDRSLDRNLASACAHIVLLPHSYPFLVNGFCPVVAPTPTPPPWL